MAEEIFDVVDAQDRVIGQAPRSEVHAQGWLHRAVSIFVVNSRGQLLVHKRTSTKDEYPSCYTSSASGHLSAGESYDEAAPRELLEELGLSTPLRFLAQFPGGPETANEHTALYETLTDVSPVFAPAEIESGKYYDLPEIADQIARHPQTFTPPFRVLFRWYYEQKID